MPINFPDHSNVSYMSFGVIDSNEPQELTAIIPEFSGIKTARYENMYRVRVKIDPRGVNTRSSDQ